MASPLRWTDENGGVPSRPQHLRYPCPAKRPTDALGESKYSKLEPRNPGSALIAPAWSGLPICSREVPEWILPCSHIVTIYSFQCIFFVLLWPLIDVFLRKVTPKDCSRRPKKKNWNVTTKAMCKLYWIASAPARKPYRIGYELWFWRVFCDEAPRRSLKGRVTYIGKKFILKRIDFRAASKWMWIEFAHVQLYANLQGSVTIYGIS